MLGNLGEQVRRALLAAEEEFLVPLGSCRVIFIEGISKTCWNTEFILFQTLSDAVLLPALLGLWGWGWGGKKQSFMVSGGHSAAQEFRGCLPPFIQ